MGVPALEQLLQEAAKLAHSDAGALACVQGPPHALLQHLYVRGLLLADRCAEGVVGAEEGVLCAAHPPRRDRPVTTSTPPERPHLPTTNLPNFAAVR